MGKGSNSILGDKRLEQVYPLLVGAMISRYSVILRQLSNNRGEEVRFGRFINNQKITGKSLIDFHWSHSCPDVRGQHLLVISDSSTLSFSPHAHRLDLGYVGPKTDKRGFDVHPSILVNARTYANYGLGGIRFYKTEDAQTKEEQQAKQVRRKERYKTLFEDKERYKWFDSPRQAIQNCPEASCYTLLGDRESDIYALMSRTLDQGWQFLFRSRTERRLVNGQNLRPTINSWEVQHRYKIDIAAVNNRSPHTANLEVKFGQVAIKCPKDTHDESLPQHIDIHVVEVKENPNSVLENEAPIHWTLLTSHPVTNTKQALQIIKWYCWRWTIEQVFRTLKLKGLNVENSEVESLHALQNLTTLALIAANQVMQLVQARNGQTEQKLSDVFLPNEQKCLIALNAKIQGKTKKSKNPYPEDSLAFATWIIARLGGWKGYQSEKKPGPITLTKGLIKFFNILEGFYLML